MRDQDARPSSQQDGRRVRPDLSAQAAITEESKSDRQHADRDEPSTERKLSPLDNDLLDFESVNDSRLDPSPRRQVSKERG